jgi:hypothetical protein
VPIVPARVINGVIAIIAAVAGSVATPACSTLAVRGRILTVEAEHVHQRVDRPRDD